MQLGLNLSFAVKRWLKPENLARMCSQEFNVNTVQFTFDLIDPWWPTEQRDTLAKEYREAFSNHGVNIASTFGGVASYSYAQLLAPTKAQRDISLEFFKRAIDLTSALGADVMGTPIGGMTYEDAKDEAKTEELYNSAKQSLIELADYAKKRGLREIQIEATPLTTEILYTPQAAKRFMKELDGKTAVPVRLLIDWGHALFNKIPGTTPDMLHWLNECAPYVNGIHLQQTDGLYDRHWDFTSEGIIDIDLIKEVSQRAGVEDIVQYLEVVTIFEESDEVVFEGIKKSMQYLHRLFE